VSGELVTAPEGLTYDVVVLGTGAAGLTAALAAADEGAEVGLFEKSAHIGGTTALSGGVVWLPNNPLGRDAGVADSREQSLRYLDALSNQTMRPEMVSAFIDGVDDLVEWLHSRTPLRLQLVPRYPDYHPEHPGALPGGGRSLEPALISTDGLGEWTGALVGEPRRFLIGDIPSGGGTGVIPADVRAERDAGNLEGLGRGLVAGLLQGLLERGVEPHTEMRAESLLVEDGRVAGVTFSTPAGTLTVRANRGVVLATGGFEWSPELVAGFLRGPIAHPPGVRSNTGDGLRMAMRLGAGLGSMPQAWWVPVVTPAGQLNEDGTQASLLLLRERTLPGTVMVNRKGRRFANEAANYNAFGAALHAFDVGEFAYANIPAWLVLDGRCVRTYGCFGTAPGSEPPAWLIRADSVEELADRIDVPADALRDTLARFNSDVAEGRDRQFRRGESLYDGWCGDQAHYGTPAATLATVGEPPFYATAVHASTLGTKGGPLTTPNGEVLDVDGNLISGLYAAGNAMAAPTGIAYGGAGGTLGPAMVFGQRAGRAAAGMPATPTER
jgi:succinate dehydrogenase/fumarate reductase flavoprotein subunit